MAWKRANCYESWESWVLSWISCCSTGSAAVPTNPNKVQSRSRSSPRINLLIRIEFLHIKSLPIWIPCGRMVVSEICLLTDKNLRYIIDPLHYSAFHYKHKEMRVVLSRGACNYRMLLWHPYCRTGGEINNYNYNYNVKFPNRN